MNLEQLRARCAAIVARLGEIQEIENHSEENFTEINSLHEEFEGLKKNISAKEKIAAMTSDSTVSARQVTSAPVSAKIPAGQIQVGNKKIARDFGYTNGLGNFFKDVATKSMGGDLTQNLKNVQNAAEEKIGEDGGFLVAPTFLDEIQKKVEGDESLLPMTRQLTSSRNSLEVPINETAPWDVEGVNAYWEGESDVHTASKSKFKMHQFRLHKLTAYVPVSEELLDDAPALESFLQTEASDAILHKINSAILTGTGAGMPNGILNSGFKVVVNKESGQTSTELLFENIIKMYSHCLPKARAKAVWIYNPALEEKLRLMKFDNGAASPVPVFLPPGGLSESPYATIMGRPAIPMLGATKGLGSEGDIQFVDLSFYYSVMKSGAGAIQQFMSTHVLFDRDQVAFKFRIRMAGNCPFIAPVNPENGVYPMSGLITLQDR